MYTETQYFGEPVDRAQRERMNLYRLLSGFVKTLAFTNELGGDPIVRALAAAENLPEADLVILRVSHSGRILTVVLCPGRVWRERRRSILNVKHRARELGVPLLLMPSRWLKAPARLGVHKAILEAMTRKAHPEYRNRLLRFMMRRKSSTIGQCLRQFSNSSHGMQTILSLCGAGWINIDRSSPITDDSLVVWNADGSFRLAVEAHTVDRPTS